MRESIRLTNKTAIALRKNAKKIRTAYFVAAVIVSVLLGAAGIFLGFMWLPSVPLMIAAIALIDCALMTASRSRYLSLVGQAICTEAAARELSADRIQENLRKQAVEDLMRVKADAQKAMTQQPDAQPFFEKKNDEDVQEAEAPMSKIHPQPSADAPRRRRQQNPLTLIRGEQIK